MPERRDSRTDYSKQLYGWIPNRRVAWLLLLINRIVARGGISIGLLAMAGWLFFLAFSEFHASTEMSKFVQMVMRSRRFGSGI